MAHRCGFGHYASATLDLRDLDRLSQGAEGPPSALLGGIGNFGFTNFSSGLSVTSTSLGW